MHTVDNLRLVDEGITSDVTGLFLRLNPESREKFCDVADAIAAASVADPESVSASSGLEVGRAARQILGDLYEDFHIHMAVGALAACDGETLQEIAEEMRKITNGDIALTHYQRKAMSNLSNMGRYTYEAVLGVNLDTLPGPILDIGTGEEAHFAGDLLDAQPEITVTSTSVHLGQKKSRMREILSSNSKRGLFIAADGARLPIANDQFKTVVSVNAAPYYMPQEEVPVFLSEVRRVMQPVGATALISPALCDYGNTELTQNYLDSCGPDIELEDMPEAGYRHYSHDVPRKIIVIKS